MPTTFQLVTTLRVVMPWGRSASCDHLTHRQLTNPSRFAWSESGDAERPHGITTRSVVTR